MDYKICGISGSDFCTLSALTHDQVGSPTSPVNLMVQSLNYNGGLTLTHALLSGSPAIDQITSVTNNCQIGVTLDQRGALRILACDIGAYEFDQVSYVYLPLLIR